METISLPNNIKMKCEDLDEKRKVCAINGEAVVLKNSKLSNYQMDPSLADPEGIIMDGKGYEDYFKNYLKNRGNEEKLTRIKKIKNKL